MKGLISQKTLIRVLLVVCILSVLSVSVFASGTSTTPAYPTSTYTYVTGYTSTGSISTSSGTYFDAVTQSFKGIGNILLGLRAGIKNIDSHTSYLSEIATDTNSISTINTYVQSNNTWLSKLYTEVSAIKTAMNTTSAWTSTQASSVTSDVASLGVYGKNISTNSTSMNSFLSQINNKVATDSTLKTLATETTVSSIKNILTGFKSNLDTIAEKTSDLAEVLASEEDKQLHDNSKSNLDYVNNTHIADKVTDTSKFDSASSAVSGFQEAFLGAGGSASGDFSGAFSELNESGYSFWSSTVYNQIHQSETSSSRSKVRSKSMKSASDMPYDVWAEYEKAIALFGGGD